MAAGRRGREQDSGTEMHHETNEATAPLPVRMAPLDRRRVLAAAAGAVTATLFGPAGAAAIAAGTAEARFEHSTVRLLDGGPAGESSRLAGIAVILFDGWKTYWKVPGDSGMPPEFDFSGSGNLAKAAVLWPAPYRFSDPDLGESIGYKKLVVFPVRVRAVDPARPVLLRLRMNYALCSDICIPAEARLARRLPPAGAAPADAEEARLVRRFLALVPRTDPGGIEVAGARVRPGKGRPELVVRLKGEGLDETTDILVEGPDIVSFCHPRYIGPQKDGSVAYFLPVDGIARPEDLSGVTLRLTILAGEKRVERGVQIP